VRHGRNRKRRAGRIGRTKLKNRNYSKFKPPQITDEVVRSNWDPTKTASVNMANLGLQSNLNDSVVKPASFASFPPTSTSDSKTTTTADSNKVSAIELFNIPESDVIPAQTKRLRMLPVSVEDQQFIIKCIHKYGVGSSEDDDENDETFQKMACDIKVNDMQHTKNKLKKMVARFMLLEESQLRVEVSDEIKALMKKK